MVLRSFAILLVALSISGCREATQAPEVDLGLPPLGAPPRAVTFSAENDVTPAWSPDGDSLYYSTVGLHPFPEIRGLILRVPRNGGRAEPALPRAQLSEGATRRWLTTPTPSPTGDALAVMEIWGDKPAELCRGTVSAICFPETGPHGPGTPGAPTLTAVILRVRAAGSSEPLEAQLAHRIDFDGRDEAVPVLPGEELLGFPLGPGWVHRVRYHPFHQISDREGAAFYRPSWSPDGRRIVYSDGLRLLILDVDTGEVTPIPGTDDGVFPAWSPDGDRIAFTRLLRGPAIATTCDHLPPPDIFHGQSTCKQVRVGWPIQGRRVVTVAPDGGALRTRGVGDQPAWMPDGESLVFRRDGRLWAGHVEALELARPLTDTQGASAPSVSADGRWVAFQRTAESGSDLWVLELP